MIRSFNGKTPRIAESAFVSEVAYVIGDVEIGENSGIWPGAVVRGDFAPITIGTNSHIEDNSVVHAGTPVTIGDDVLIGHSVVMHGVKIGNEVLIGNNTTILDDADIGNLCIIAANSLVSEGMSIPERSFVAGVPAKVKGELSEKQIGRLKEGSLIYSELAKSYKREAL